jgi:hypothetical protein
MSKIVLALALLLAAPAHAQKWSRFLFDVGAGIGYAPIVDWAHGNGDAVEHRVSHNGAATFRLDLGGAINRQVGLVVHGSALLFFPTRSPRSVDYLLTFDPVVLRLASKIHRPGHLIGHLGVGVGFLSSIGNAPPGDHIPGFHFLAMLTVSVWRGLGVAFAFDFGAFPTRTVTPAHPESVFFPFALTTALTYHLD